MSGVCYAGKSAILKKNHYFYLHTRHLRSILGACHAGKSDVFFENCNFTCINDIWCCSYAGKIDVFFWELQFYEVKLIKTYKNELKEPQGGQRTLKKKQKSS